MLKGEKSRGHTHRQRAIGNERLLEGEIITSGDEPFVGYPMKNGQLWNHIETNKNKLFFIYLWPSTHTHIYKYTDSYIYIYVTIIKKRFYQLETV